MAVPYTVSSLWRYPVKSMAGERLQTVHVSSRGLTGDRAYALVDMESHKVGSAKNAKRFGALLRWKAQFVSEPEPDGSPPPVRLTMPGGRAFQCDEEEAQTILNEAFGPGISLVNRAPEGLLLEIAAGTLGGKYSETTELPVSSGAPAGTLFNYASVHILTTSTLKELRAAYPDGQLAIERFRPNIVVDCAEAPGFVENSWIGRTIAIGSGLVVRVSIPCPRCVVTTLPRTDLPHDPRILQTIAQVNKVNLGDFGDLPCVGVYADVIEAGSVREGDTIRVG